MAKQGITDIQMEQAGQSPVSAAEATADALSESQKPKDGTSFMTRLSLLNTTISAPQKSKKKTKKEVSKQSQLDASSTIKEIGEKLGGNSLGHDSKVLGATELQHRLKEKIQQLRSKRNADNVSLN